VNSMEQKTRVVYVKLMFKNSISIFLFDDEALSARAAATAHRVGTVLLCVFLAAFLTAVPAILVQGPSCYSALGKV
jgi:hypothetical protein